jgi:WD40 repeat protein
MVRVFRDETGLAITPAMWPAIETAMAESQYFLLLASPEAAKSYWVRREVEYWLNHRTPDTLLLVLTGGELRWDPASRDFDWAHTTAVPDVLRGVFRDEPLWVDLRWAKTGKRPSLRDAKFQQAVATILATLVNRPKDDLLSEEITQRRRDLRLAAAAISMIMSLLLVASSLGIVAAIQRNQAVQAEATAKLEAEVSLSNEYASDALASLSVDPERGILLALEAMRVQPTMAAKDALRQAVVASHVRGVVRHVPEVRTYQVGIDTSPVAVAFSPDGKLLLTGGGDHLAVLSTVPSCQQVAVLAGHTGQITAVAFSPDGRRALTASRDGTVIIWNVSTHAGIATLVGHKGPVLSASFSPDGREIVTAGADGTARVWDVGTAEQLALLQGHKGEVRSASFSPDGQRILTASTDGTARVWDAATGAAVIAPMPISEILADSSANVVAYSHDGRLIATATGLGVSLWDAATGQQRFALSTLAIYSSVNSVAFSHDDKWLLATSVSGGVIWDVASGREVTSFQSGSGLFELSAAFSPDDQEVVAAGEDGTAQVWDILGGKLQANLLGHTARVDSAVFSPDGRWVATGSADGTARLWEVVGNEIAEYRTANAVPSEYLPVAPPVDVEVDSSGRVSIVKRTTQATVTTWTAPHGQPEATAVDEQGRWAALQYQDGLIDVGTVGTGSTVASLHFVGPGVIPPMFSPDGRWLVAASAVPAPNGALVQELFVWDTQTWRQVADLVPTAGSGNKGGPVEALAFSADSSELAAAFYNAAVVWGVGNWQQRSSLVGHTSQISGLAFSPNGRLVLTTGQDLSVRLWNATSGTLAVPVMRGHDGWVRSGAFSPDGSLVVTASEDGTVRLWSVATGGAEGVLPGAAGPFDDAQFSADGRWIMASARTGQVLVYATSIQDVEAAARSQLTRGLTCQEEVVYLHVVEACATG